MARKEEVGVVSQGKDVLGGLSHSLSRLENTIFPCFGQNAESQGSPSGSLWTTVRKYVCLYVCMYVCMHACVCVTPTWFKEDWRHNQQGSGFRI